MTAESSRHTERTFVVRIDQQGRDGVLRVCCEVIEKKTDCATRVPAWTMGLKHVVADIHFARQEPRPVDPSNDFTRHKDTECWGSVRWAVTEETPRFDVPPGDENCRVGECRRPNRNERVQPVAALHG